MIDLAALRADGSARVNPEGCWADKDALGVWGACGETPVDRLGLCCFHREELFGLTREPDTSG